MIGELDTILERFEKKKTSFETQLARMVLESKDDTDLRRQFDELSENILSVQAEVEQDQSGRAPLQNILNAVGRTVEVKP